VDSETILYGFNSSLNKYKKKLCPPYPLKIGIYSLENCTHAMIEAKSIMEVSLEGVFKRHDPKIIV
jgi:hypothetical protein